MSSANKPPKSIPRAELIEHLQRYRCTLKYSGRWGEIYWKDITNKKEYIPSVDQIASKLVKKICDGLEVNYPKIFRQLAPYDRTFENAIQHLTKQGYSPIRKKKFRMFDFTPEKGGSLSYPAEVTRELFPLESLEELEGEDFWMPVGFDGFKIWHTEYCAPHWIESESRAARTRWCNKHWRETIWPDQGEVSDDPTDFINRELGGLKCDLKGSSITHEKHRKKLRETLQDLGVIGSEYLAEGIELALKVGGAASYEQVSKEDLLDHEGISPDVDKDITRILELAFRAGRVSATHSAYSRGVASMAQAGASMVLQAGKGRPKAENQKKEPSLKKWQKAALPKLKLDEGCDRRDLLGFLLQKETILEDSPGVYREAETAEGGSTFCYESFRKKVSRLISTEKKRTV
jgi:hypothetical protein